MNPDPADHDPSGTDLARQITASLAGILPPPQNSPVRRRRVDPDDEQRSGSHPDARDPQLVGSALDDLVDARGWRTQINVRSLLSNWAELVGPAIAAHSKPESFDDRVLVVRAESTTWASALRSMAGEVIATINKRLGSVAVHRIDVRGPAGPSWKHGRRSVRDGRGPRDTYG